MGNGISEERVAAYLPTNYRIAGSHTNARGDFVVEITGYDDAGWTFESYVQPRLASGNMFAKEI